MKIKCERCGTVFDCANEILEDNTLIDGTITSECPYCHKEHKIAQ